MLHVAQCTDSFLPVKDGVGRVAFEYARALGERGHDCCVVTPMEATPCRGRYPFEIVDFLSVPQTAEMPLRMGVAALDLHYVARIDALPLDLVHTHSPGLAGMEAVRLADKLKIPLVGTFHPKYLEKYFSPGEDGLLAASNERFILDYFNRCDEIWTVSEEAKEFLLRHGVGCNIEVFENGADEEPVPLEAVAKACETFHLTSDPILLSVGSLDRMKNLPRILAAASLLQKRGVAFQLVFAGRGPEEAAAKAIVQSLGLVRNVRFLGHISDTGTLDALYAAAALCLFPYRSLSAGLVVCEAAVQGTPSLVIAGSSSAKRIVNGKNGLTAGDTPESMADAVAAFLASPEKIAAMGRAARETVPVPWRNVMDKIEARYMQLAERDRAALTRKRGPFRKELQQVDNTLEKRTMDLIASFLRQDLARVYAYPYQPVKTGCEPVEERAPLPRSTPEEAGVSSRALTDFLLSLDSDPAAAAQEIMVLRHGRVIAEGSWAPYTPRYPHELYSLSKSVTSTAVGMLVNEGRLDLDEKLSDIFFDLVPEDASHPVYAMRVRHLLNMSTGSLFNEVGTALGADWEREFLRAGTKFAPGTQFDYNSMNTYMLSAILRRKTGLTLTEYLTPRLFLPLGIDSYLWDTAPGGTEKGGWGLHLTLESVAKIGQLYLNGGVWTVNGQEKRLLSRAWVDEATSPQIETPNGEITYGYGHQMWMTAHPGAFLFNGAFGQYMLALPDKDVIVVLFSGTSRLFAEGGVTDAAERTFSAVSEAPLPADPDGLALLRRTLDGLTVQNRRVFHDPARTLLPIEALLERLDGRVYAFPHNIGGLLPMILSNVTNNYPTGVDRVAFRKEPDGGLRLEVAEGETVHKLLLPACGFSSGTISGREDVYAVRVSMEAWRDESETLFMQVNLHFIETPFTRILRFAFRDDAVRLVLDECPSVKEASEMVLELAGITRQQVFRNMMPLLKREKLQHTFRTFTTVTIEGKL